MSEATAEQVRGLEASVDQLRREVSELRVMRADLTEVLDTAGRAQAEAQKLRLELAALVAQNGGAGFNALVETKVNASARLGMIEREAERSRTNLEQRYEQLASDVRRLGDAGTVRGRVEWLERAVGCGAHTVRIVDRVERLELEVRRFDPLEKRITAVESKAPDLQDMSEEELNDEVCKVLSSVLDGFEGDDTPLLNYGENRVKHLLAVLKERE